MKAEWAMYRGAQRLEVTSDKLQEEKFRDVIGWVTNSPSSLSYSGALWNWNLFERAICIGSPNEVTLLEVSREAPRRLCRHRLLD